MLSLLKDIRLAAIGRTQTDPARALLGAVIEHLGQLFSTPMGSVLLARDYGTEDPTRLFHEYPESARDMARHLQELIGWYEPRLARVSVTHVKMEDVDLVLRFDIDGTLVLDGRLMPVRFSAFIDSDNHLELR